MRDILHLLRWSRWYHWRTFINSIRQRRAGWFLLLLILSGAALFALLDVVIVGSITAALNNQRLTSEMAISNPQALLDQLPALLLLANLLLLVFINAGLLIGELFFSSELERLFLAPITPRAVLFAQLLNPLTSNYTALFYLALLPLWAYGFVLGYGLGFMLLALLVVIVLPLPAIISSAFVLLLVIRVVPLRRLREAIGVLGSLMGIGCYVLSQVAITPTTAKLAQGWDVSSLAALTPAWLPTTWAGTGLRAFQQGGWAWLALLAFVGISLAAFGGGTLLFERVYFERWQAWQSSANTRRRKQRTAGSSTKNWHQWGSQTQALLRKDARLLRRDVRQFVQMLWPLAFLGIYVWRMLTDNDMRVASGPLLIGVILLVCVSFSSRLSLNSISREGQTFWILRTAPISTTRLVLSKFLLAWLVYPLLGGIMIALTLALGLSTLSFSVILWVILMITGAGCTALYIGLGAAFPVLTWDKPERQISRPAGCLGGVLLWLFLGGVVVLWGLMLAPNLPRLMGQPAPLHYGIQWQISAGLGAVLLTAIVSWISLMFGISRLQRLEDL